MLQSDKQTFEKVMAKNEKQVAIGGFIYTAPLPVSVFI